MAYRTPDEAKERGEAWVARPGEPQDLRDPYHYQSPDESRALGRDWATQAAGTGGRQAYLTPDEAQIGGVPWMPPASMGALMGMPGMPQAGPMGQPKVIGYGPDGKPVYGNASPATHTLGGLIAQPASQNVAAPDWSYLTRPK